MRYFAHKCTRRRSERDCSQTERDDDRRYVNMFGTAQDDISCNSTRRRSFCPRNNRTSFQTLSANWKCSVKCDANSMVPCVAIISYNPVLERVKSLNSTERNVQSFEILSTCFGLQMNHFENPAVFCPSSQLAEDSTPRVSFSKRICQDVK